MCNSFQAVPGGGVSKGLGTNLFQALSAVPPRVPTEPVSTLRKKRHRATCQPPRLPMEALRHVWAASRPWQSAT